MLVDTGPLVAILSREDEFHDVCLATLREMSGPLLSCWPVMTEAAWLLRRVHGAVQKLLQSVESGFIELLPLAGTEAAAISTLMKRYENIEPQLADVALIHLAERERIETIFTLDRRDFSVYRAGGKRKLRIVPEIK